MECEWKKSAHSIFIYNYLFIFVKSKSDFNLSSHREYRAECESRKQWIGNESENMESNCRVSEVIHDKYSTYFWFYFICFSSRTHRCTLVSNQTANQEMLVLFYCFCFVPFHLLNFAILLTHRTKSGRKVSGYTFPKKEKEKKKETSVYGMNNKIKIGNILFPLLLLLLF